MTAVLPRPAVRGGRLRGGETAHRLAAARTAPAGAHLAALRAALDHAVQPAMRAQAPHTTPTNDPRKAALLNRFSSSCGVAV